MDAEALRAKLSGVATLRAQGRVAGVTGLSLRAQLPGARIGDVLTVSRRGAPLRAEVVGFASGDVIAMPFGDLRGVGPDDLVQSDGQPLRIAAGEALLGRVLNGFGEPLDKSALPAGLSEVPAVCAPPPALTRKPVDQVLPTGVRVIDGLLTVGVGQRVGLFAGSGVGKSTLLGNIAKGVQADIVVIALVGERGREVGEFITDCLGEALNKSVLVVATSDSPALERLKAAQTATAIAEYFRDQGKSVMLLVDSVTRYARALREIGLAAGEPPARRGYPPSVFAELPRLLERTGQSSKGAITALYTVLVEGGDMEEPIADEVRGILDGHIVMDRAIAARGHYPAVDVPRSLSRVMGKCVSEQHSNAASVVRALLGVFDEKRDLIQLGAYKRGADAAVDKAVAALPSINQFLQQRSEPTPYDVSVQQLAELSERFG